MDNTLAQLSKQELVKVVEMFSANWLTVDGLWFTMVEDAYGLETALDMDLKMWQRMALIQAQRIKKYMGIEGGGVAGVLKAIRFAVFDPAMPYRYAMEGEGREAAIMWVPSCRPQEGRLRAGRAEFPCKEMGMACYETLAKTIDPAVSVECLFCPPDDHPSGIWCKWRLTCRKDDE